MKINFTNYLREREVPLTNDVQKNIYLKAITTELQEAGLTGTIEIEYFQTGALVTIDGRYYNTWKYEAAKFMSGSVGDY
jgi:hypothetical protein